MTEPTNNPFAAPKETRDVISSDDVRSIEEVKAAMVVAKRFPRDEMAAMDRILKACTRPTLAESAVFAYPRGGAMITGPSIRLAETIAQGWGNISFGIRELSQSKGESVVEAFAWDVETNTKQVKVFTVKHARKARGQTKTLDDPRDIYEMVANQGARRLRACILGIIPGDVTDAALKQSEVTLANSSGVPEEEIKKLVKAFEPLGITADMLRQRLGHDLEATIAVEIINLRKIYVSLRDGMSSTADWFSVSPPERQKAETVTTGDGVKDLETAIDDASAISDAPAWPKRRHDGVWVDKSGAEWDPQLHAGAGAGGTPAINKDGTFRARRGAKHAEQPESTKSKLEKAMAKAAQHRQDKTNAGDKPAESSAMASGDSGPTESAASFKSDDGQDLGVTDTTNMEAW